MGCLKASGVLDSRWRKHHHAVAAAVAVGAVVVAAAGPQPLFQKKPQIFQRREKRALEI